MDPRTPRLQSTILSGLSFPAQCPQRLSQEHVGARQRARRRSPARAVIATPPSSTPGAGCHSISNSCVAAAQDSPRAPAAPSTPASKPGEAVLDRAPSRRAPRAGAERPVDRRLVEPLKLRHRDGPDENQHAAEQRHGADDGDAERGVVDDLAQRRQDLAHVDGRDVRDTAGPARARARRSAPRRAAPAGIRRTCAAPGRSRAPGGSTNMNPPFCASSHVTLRMLVTRARTTRPPISNRIRSPTSTSASSWTFCSIETSVSASSDSVSASERPAPERARRQRSRCPEARPGT